MCVFSSLPDRAFQIELPAASIALSPFSAPNAQDAHLVSPSSSNQLAFHMPAFFRPFENAAIVPWVLALRFVSPCIARHIKVLSPSDVSMALGNSQYVISDQGFWQIGILNVVIPPD